MRRGSEEDPVPRHAGCSVLAEVVVCAVVWDVRSPANGGDCANYCLARAWHELPFPTLELDQDQHPSEIKASLTDYNDMHL